MELVLAATDWSENARRAIRRAAYIGAQRDAQCMLMHVGEYGWPARLIGAKSSASVRTSATRLEQLAQSVHVQTGVRFETQVQIGNAAYCLARAARIKNASLIVVGQWTDTALIQWTNTPFEQSMVLRLLNQTNTPVLISKSAPDRPYRRVLVATDLSAHASACLEQAYALTPDAEMMLAHAIDDSREKLPRLEVHDGRMQEFRAKQHEMALDRIQNLLTASNFTTSQVGKAVCRSYAPKFILDMEQEFSADLLVLGGREQSRFRHLFFGGITSQVVARSRCDVLIVPRHVKVSRQTVKKLAASN